jgi:hypothetical protein
MITSKRSMKQTDPSESESRLDDLFRAYGAACPEPDASVSFMPDLWASIEAREASRNWFGRVAKALVTAALAASAIGVLISGIMISSRNQSSAFFNATFVEALRDDRMSTLEPLHLDRIYEFEPK